MVSLHACLLAAALAGNSDTVLLSFTADWCGHCRLMQPTVQRLLDAGYPIREVNIDQNPGLGQPIRSAADCPASSWFATVAKSTEWSAKPVTIGWSRCSTSRRHPAAPPALPLAAPASDYARSVSR